MEFAVLFLFKGAWYHVRVWDDFDLWMMVSGIEY